MDNVTIIGIVTIIGALMGTLVPYLIKVYQDKNITFDMNYGYALVLGIIVQVVALIPDDVAVLTLKVILNAFAAGAGVQMFINKAVPKYQGV